MEKLFFVASLTSGHFGLRSLSPIVLMLDGNPELVASVRKKILFFRRRLIGFVAAFDLKKCLQQINNHTIRSHLFMSYVPFNPSIMLGHLWFLQGVPSRPWTLALPLLFGPLLISP